MIKIVAKIQLRKRIKKETTDKDKGVAKKTIKNKMAVVNSTKGYSTAIAFLQYRHLALSKKKLDTGKLSYQAS